MYGNILGVIGTNVLKLETYFLVKDSKKLKQPSKLAHYASQVTSPNNLRWNEEAPGRRKVPQNGNWCPN